MKITQCMTALIVSLASLPGSAIADSKPAVIPIAIPAPPAGKGEIVFFRTGFMGALISCAVSENGKKISSLPPGDYFIAVADPGKHTYTVASEATDRLTLEVEPDEVQYASCHIKMGIMAGRPVLDPANEAAFRSKSFRLVAAAKMGDGALRPDGSTTAGVSATTGPPATPLAATIPAGTATGTGSK